MSVPVASGIAALQKNEAVSARGASTDPPTKQSAGASSIVVIVLITVVLAAAVAIVAVTFLFWVPQAKSWNFLNADPLHPRNGSSEGPSPHKPLGFHSPSPVGEEGPRRASDEYVFESITPTGPHHSSVASDDDFFGDLFYVADDDDDSYPKPPDDGTPINPLDTSLGGPDISPGPLSPPEPENPPDNSDSDRVMVASETPPSTYVQGYKSSQYPGLRILLHGPSPTDPKKSTPLYEKKPQRNFCALTAGNSNLTLSENLTDLLVRAVKDTPSSISAEDLNASVAAAYAAAASRARLQPGTVVAVTLKDNPVYSKLFAVRSLTPAWEANEFGPYMSLVILGIFKQPFYPHGNPANGFHLYAVPPREIPTRNSFFSRAYKNTYRNCLKVLDIYNGRNSQSQIKQLRITLLRDATSKGPDRQLARIATAGVLLYAFRKTPSFVLDFEYDEDDSFFHEVQSALCPKTPRSSLETGSMESLRSLRS